MSLLLNELNRSEIMSLFIGILAVSIALLKDFGIIGVGFVIVSFILHELGHRQAARIHGCFSRFILDPFGLILTLISSLLPAKFLAPGYVGVYCSALHSFSYKAQLEINAAGIAINLLLSSASYIIAIVFNVSTLYTLSLINAWLALFNLLPVGPLDGAKIFQLNKKVWIIGFLTSLTLLIGCLS